MNTSQEQATHKFVERWTFRRGSEAARLEQLDGSPFPEGLAEVSHLAELPHGCSAKATVTSYKPPLGDSRDRNDSFLPRRRETWIVRDCATTETLVAYDSGTGIETETVTSTVAPAVIRQSLHGILLSTEALGETTASSYDAFARVAQTWRAAILAATGTTGILPVASYDYSPADDLLVTHTYTNDAEIITETYAYDMLGNRVATTDALGNTVFRTCDPLGHVIAEWGATYPVRHAYDTQGRRTSLSTTRDGTTWDTTTWTYDPFTGNCLSKTYADGSTVMYTYTLDNLPLRTTYTSGKWKENVYDARRRLCGVVYSSPDMDYELQLDEYGNATNAQDAAGNAWRYAYGFNSKLLAEEHVSTGGTRSSASAKTNGISRSYDSFDRPIGFALSVNGEPKVSIGYAYDDDGDLTRIAATNATGQFFSVAYTNVTGYNYGYTLTTPNGGTLRRIIGRDDFRRGLVTNCATYFNSSLVDSNVYTFDALSRPVSRTAGATGVSPVASFFAYNERSEVLSAAIGTNLFEHVYDGIGNHLLFSANAATNTYSHNALNQIIIALCGSVPLCEPAYTPDGGLASDGIWAYAYDAEDQLVAVTSASITNGAIRVLNTYDYRHRRTSKTVQRLSVTTAPPPSPPITTQEWETTEIRTFVYDDWNLIHATVYTIEGAVTNTTEFQYFWGLDISGTLQGAGGVGGLLAVFRNGQFCFPAYDNNGNITKYIDESGSIVAAYEYDDFGRILSQSGPLADFFRHRFSTKYYDHETGLYYYGYRFYSSNWRIWLNRDPKGEYASCNLRLFSGNNSVLFVDGLGLDIIVIKHMPGEAPLTGWPEKHCRALTVYKSPSYTVKEEKLPGGKITFKVNVYPPDSFVDIYFRDASAYLGAMKYERDHVWVVRRHEQAVQNFKKRVEAIVNCPIPARKAMKVEEDLLVETTERLRKEDESYDSKGGPHDL